MLVGNKSDRIAEREVSTQEGHALARELGCEFVEASAKNYINVDKAFYDVVRILRRQRQAASQPHSPTGASKYDSRRADSSVQSEKGRHRGRERRGRGCVIL
jgi:GTPase KRas protein